MTLADVDVGDRAEEDSAACTRPQVRRGTSAVCAALIPTHLMAPVGARRHSTLTEVGGWPGAGAAKVALVKEGEEGEEGKEGEGE